MISKPAKWDIDGESFRQFHIVNGNPTEHELREEFCWRCGCEHDCCGHVSSSICGTRRLSGGRIAVKTYGWRNI